jgi:ketosteroid isomerase-like protein
MDADPKAVVQRFNKAINARDLEGLVALMTEDHAFIDSSGDVERGKETMKAGWQTFFERYPDYQNIFEAFSVDGDRVAMRGYSTCSNEPVLDGPAIWTARVRDGLVSEWRVFDDNRGNRRKFGL